jgi:hypothetical protein
LLRELAESGEFREVMEYLAMTGEFR